MSTVVLGCPAVPAGTQDQRLEALRRANDFRVRRAELKRDLRAGRVSVAEVLGDVPEWAASMRVVDLLVAVPRVGRVRATRCLSDAEVSLVKTLGGMTRRQRMAVAGLVAGWSGGRWS